MIYFLGLTLFLKKKGSTSLLSEQNKELVKGKLAGRKGVWCSVCMQDGRTWNACGSGWDFLGVLEWRSVSYVTSMDITLIISIAKV